MTNLLILQLYGILITFICHFTISVQFGVLCSVNLRVSLNSEFMLLF